MSLHPEPLTGLVFSLAGPGRVGASLAHWACACGARLDQVARRDPAVPFSGFPGTIQPLTELDSSASELLLLALPDGVMATAAHILAREAQAPVVLHTSGRTGAEVLAPLRGVGAAVGSLHPLKAFPGVLPRREDGVGTVFAVDGDRAALVLAERLAAAFGGTAVPVPGSARPLYHLAATLVAGGAVTLHALAREIARALDLDPAVADGYAHLGLTALTSAWPEPSSAITGPVARGDHEGTLGQLRELRSRLPEQTPLHVILALSTLRILAQEGSLTPDQRRLARELEALARAPDFLDPLSTSVLS